MLVSKEKAGFSDTYCYLYVRHLYQPWSYALGAPSKHCNHFCILMMCWCLTSILGLKKYKPRGV